MTVSRETEQLLNRYADGIRLWNPSINLVSPRDLPDLKARHIEDALAILPHLPTSGRLADLGSGGGFPAVPIAVCRPEVEVFALESDRRKVAFLQYIKGSLDLKNFHPEATRIEHWGGGAVDIVTARACAALEILIAYAAPLLHSSSRCYFFKGQKHAEEIRAAQRYWGWDMKIHPNPNAADSVILELWNIRAHPTKNT